MELLTSWEILLTVFVCVALIFWSVNDERNL
jgi:hypothetical protein